MHGHEVLMVERWWRQRSWLLFWRRLGHGPHVHGDGPVGLDHCLPNLGQDDLAVRSHKVIVALVDMGTYDVDVKESLLDELFHSLVMLVFAREKHLDHNLPSKFYKDSRES
jgi:hypothetical protein